MELLVVCRSFVGGFWLLRALFQLEEFIGSNWERKETAASFAGRRRLGRDALV